ncbi:MAG: PAS domain S-box protein, partial [Nitrospirae bacterium]|nr:PAS domain S-box protein [Nitrospirota bacterium]
MMPSFRDIPIRKKLMFIMMLTSSITLVVVSLAFILYDALKVRQSIREELLSTADMIAYNTAAALVFNDQEAARKNLLFLQDHSYVFAAYIIAGDNNTFARYIAKNADKEVLMLETRENRREASIDPDVLSQYTVKSNTFWDFDLDLAIVRKILLDGEVIGTVVLQAHTLGLLLSRMKWFIALAVVVMAAASFIAYLISSRLQGFISDPILHLVRTMKTVSEKKTYSVRPEKKSSDEVGLLYDGFNDMLADIQRRGEKLEEYHRHLEEEIVKRTKASDDWRTTFDATREIIIMLDREYHVIKVNRACTLFFGRSFSEILGRPVSELFEGTDFLAEKNLLYDMEHIKMHVEREVFWPQKDLWLFISADPVWDDRNNLNGSVFIIRDITDLKKAAEEHKELQTQLLQMQKLDSIGRLAGGIAHDFNNILSSIMGYCELTMRKLPNNDPVRENLKIIYSAGEKAAALTRQLLLFSRRQVLEMKTVSLNSVIENMTKMLVRLIG